MTAIAAIRTRTNVVMGGDSAGVAGLSLSVRKDSKVFRVGPYLIGYTSSFRMGQLLRYGCKTDSLEDLRPVGDPLAFMVQKFVPRVRDILKAGAYTEIENSRESGGAFLVAWGRWVFGMHSDFQVEQPGDSYTACGCGFDLALGSLYSTEGDPRGRIELALKAAERHSAGVRGPFTILET